MTRNQAVGRNDPCPCGSGKKYKRCCLAADERQAAEQRLSGLPEPEPEPEEAPAALPPSGVHQIPALLQELARRSASPQDRAEFEDLLARTQPLLDYVAQQPAIEEAAQTLEAHRAEFEQLTEDEAAYLERTGALFAEERFAPLRFTADDVRRAFDKVGKPVRGGSDDQFVKTVRAAILHLADQDRRNESALRLLGHLPDYVAANRPLEAWILQYCAYLTQEQTDESNPFLFQMFSYGYDAWVAEQRAVEMAILGEMGLDLPRLERMSMEEIEAWLQEQQADPAKRARMENLLLRNPEIRAQSEARLEQLEREAHKLLQRPDAAHLLLSPEELQPWLPQFIEAFQSVSERCPDLASPAPSQAAGKALLDALLPLVRQMVGTLFAPERVGRLTAQLKAYRNERFAAGDKQTAEAASGALLSLQEESAPDCNRFLCALGYLSLLQGLETTAT